jgi:N6-adenosine-specific RNA methylase IME4
VQDVARAWGFKPISEIVWLKRYPSGKARIGTGYPVRTMHEPILVCTVGNPRHHPFPSTFDGVARGHSRKPDEFYDLVLSYSRRPSGVPIYSAGMPVRDLTVGATSTASLTRAR